MWCGSSVGFYGCVGVSMLQSLAGGQWFIGRVLLVFVGAFLLLLLAGGQWFIGSLVCPSVRCGAVHRSGSMGVSAVRSCFNFLQGDSCSSARCSCQCRGDMAVIWRCGSVFYGCVGRCVSASISCRVIVVHRLGVRVNVGEIWR